MRKSLDAGKDLGMPDGVLINGKGPYRYNDTLVPDGIVYETIDVHPGDMISIGIYFFSFVLDAKWPNSSKSVHGVLIGAHLAESQRQ